MNHPRPLTNDLLEHSAFLRRLARSLVVDEHRAEDVVQETFAAALRKPPPVGVRPRAWLGAVLRNLAFRSHRTEKRVRHREQQGAQPETTTATAEIAARVEIQRRIGEAVAALDEPGRSAVVWRYFDGLLPREIAQREDVSVRTIESRLRRAREVLRVRLDSEYGGERHTWSAALVPLLGADFQTLVSTSAASTTAVSGTAGSSVGLVVAATGVALVSTKLIVGVSALCVAGAFFVGRQLPANERAPVEDPATAVVPARDDEPILRSDPSVVATRMQRQLDEANAENATLRAERTELQEKLDAAREAGFAPVDAESKAKADRTRYTPEKYKAAVTKANWNEAGEAAAKMVPLLRTLATDFGAGKEIDLAVGIKVSQLNGQLLGVLAEAVAANVPGTEDNSAFTHPVVTINLMHAALASAALPLDSKQLERMRAIGDRYIEDDARMKSGYGEETFALKKTIDENALKDRMYAEIHELLTAAQRDVLHPEDVRGRLGIDLFSSGTVWYGLARAVDFTTRDDLAIAMSTRLGTAGDLSENQRAQVKTAAQEWADSFSAEFLQASADPIAQASRRKAANGKLAGWQKIEQARIAAKHQLALYHSLVEILGLDSDLAKDVRKSRRVFIPLKKP